MWEAFGNFGPFDVHRQASVALFYVHRQASIALFDVHRQTSVALFNVHRQASVALYSSVLQLRPKDFKNSVCHLSD